MFAVGDLVLLQGHVVCDVDIDVPTTCEVVSVYPGSGTIYEVRIPGVREAQIIPGACLEWLMNEALGRN